MVTAGCGRVYFSGIVSHAIDRLQSVDSKQPELDAVAYTNRLARRMRINLHSIAC